MSDSLNDQPHFQDDRAAAQELAAAQKPDAAAQREQQPDAAGVGRAQRSEPERSGGERSGARPTPATSPSSAPGVSGPAEGETNVPYEESLAGEDEDANANVPGGVKLAGRSKGRRLVKKDLTPAPALTPEKR